MNPALRQTPGFHVIAGQGHFGQGPGLCPHAVRRVPSQAFWPGRVTWGREGRHADPEGSDAKPRPPMVGDLGLMTFGSSP